MAWGLQFGRRMSKYEVFVPFLVAVSLGVAAGCDGSEGDDVSGDAGVEIGADAGAPDADDASPISPSELSGPNWAVIDGPRVPSNGGTDVVRLRKRLVLDATDGAGLRVTDAFAMRSSVDSSWVRVAVSVANDADHTQCFVKLEGVVYRDRAGGMLGTDRGYVTGTLRSMTAVYTNTCLQPGETGYWLGIEELPYAELAGIEVRVEASELASSPAPKLVPWTYLAVSEDGRDRIEVAARHQGAVPVQLSFSRVMIIGEYDEPLHWTFLDGPAEDVVVEPGELLTLSRDLYYAGSGSRIIAWLDYDIPRDDSEPDTANAVEPPGEAGVAARLAERNRREARAEAALSVAR